MKASGSNSLAFIILVSPFGFARITSILGPNSIITYRQLPHGAINSSKFANTMIALNLENPSLTALKIAVLSAQIVSP